MFISCSSHDNDQRTEIEFWTLQLSPYFDTYFDEIIQNYEKQNPTIRITYVDIPYDAAIQKLLSAVAAGSPPDIINLSTDFLAKFDGLNVLADLSGYENISNLKKLYLNNALEECIYNGRVIALPWYLNTYAVIYNKKLLAEAGYDSSMVPQTFEEYTQFIRDYKNKTGKFATFWNIGKDSYLPMMLGSEGIAMTDSSMQNAVFDASPALEKISEWVDLVKTGYLSRDCVIKPGSAIVEPFQSAQVAMIFTGPVFLKRIKDNAPGVYAVTDIAPPLTGVTGKHELAAMSLSVMNGSKNKKEAFKFLSYILNAENQLRFCKMAPVFPSHIDALKDSYFRFSDGSLESKARIMGAEYLPTATRLRSYLRHPRFDRLRNFFDDAIQNAALTRTSTQSALQKAAGNWDAVLRED